MKWHLGALETGCRPCPVTSASSGIPCPLCRTLGRCSGPLCPPRAPSKDPQGVCVVIKGERSLGSWGPSGGPRRKGGEWGRAGGGQSTRGMLARERKAGAAQPCVSWGLTPPQGPSGSSSIMAVGPRLPPGPG